MHFIGLMMLFVDFFVFFVVKMENDVRDERKEERRKKKEERRKRKEERSESFREKMRDGFPLSRE